MSAMRWTRHGVVWNLPARLARATGTLAANLEPDWARKRADRSGMCSRSRPMAATAPTMIHSKRSRWISAAAKGRTILAETTAAGWGDGKMAAPQADYRPQRFGASPPDSLPSLRTEAGLSVLSACGVPVSLVTDADGTSQREAWRRFVMGSVEPLLAIVGQEVEAKLETRVTFDLSSLWAHDFAGGRQVSRRW